MVQDRTVNALFLRKTNDTITTSIEKISEDLLPEGNVLVKILYSTLNYKDGMILKGHGNLVRSYPHVPGIDFSGIVERSSSPLFKPGDSVILTGWRVGEWLWGGYATKASVRAEWLVPMPAGLDSRRAMSLGTAGLTAMLAVMALEAHGLSPEVGAVLVTGAAGGVGSIAVAVLARLGYRVVASTGRKNIDEYFSSLGANYVIERLALVEQQFNPLQSEKWAGAVDNVGGTTLAVIATQMRYGSSIAACGNTGGNAVPLSVLPLLLRGVKLLGIASAFAPIIQRKIAWERLSQLLSDDILDKIARVEPLSHLPELADMILQGQIQGRTVIDVNT